MGKRKVVHEHDSHLYTPGAAVGYSDASPSPPKRRKYATQQHMNEINALEPIDFRRQYITTESLSYSTKHPGHAKDIVIGFQSADTITKIELDSCFSLIESTSREDYESSSLGWHTKRKRREMKEDEMRYLLVRDSDDEHDPVLGFLSFMLTHDSTPNVPVLYIYEIHLSPALQGLGLGRHLMDVVEKIAESVAVAKIMLTCFLSNKRAHSFYKKQGYVVDVCSPEDRKTRKKLVKIDYVIMSKTLPGPYVNAASNAGAASDVHTEVQIHGDRTATDSASVHAKERRTDMEHKERTTTSENRKYNYDSSDASAAGKGWQEMFPSVLALGNKENLH